MSERVCYIRRTDRGAALRGLRLISGHSDDQWRSEPGGEPTLVIQSIDDAADWIKQRLDSNNAKHLGVLCLDPDGAVCTWVKPEEADPAMLGAVISNGPIEHDPDSLEPEQISGIGDRFPRLPDELDFEPLNTDETSTGARSAVIAVPDVPGRLLKDALDRRGIRVGRITTIWHALANIGDPGKNNNSRDAQRIVSSDAPIAAVVVADPIDHRLIWTWSRNGRLICAGSARLRSTHEDGQDHVTITQSDIARLGGDWLSWSSQLGVSPSRIVLLASPAAPDLSNTPEPEQPTQHEPALSPAEIGSALNLAWPNATLDLIDEPDPIEHILRNIAINEQPESLGAIQGLEQRPTRAHRSMFRWAGFALIAASGIIFLLGWQLFNQSGAIKEETRTLKNQRTEMLNDFDPALVMSMLPVKDLEITRDQIARARGPIQIVPSKPILDALETISFVIGAPGLEIDKITLNNRTVTLTLRVNDIAQAELINQSLKSIDDELLRWTSMTPTNRGQQIQVTYVAAWLEEENAS